MADEDGPDKREIYRIRVKGVLDEGWSDWLDGLAVLPQIGGETVLIGPIVDQAALYGLFNKMRDLGLSLVSVNQVEDEVQDQMGGLE
jgi:hypothetical protein